MLPSRMHIMCLETYFEDMELHKKRDEYCFKKSAIFLLTTHLPIYKKKSVDFLIFTWMHPNKREYDFSSGPEHTVFLKSTGGLHQVIYSEPNTTLFIPIFYIVEHSYIVKNHSTLTSLCRKENWIPALQARC